MRRAGAGVTTRSLLLAATALTSIPSRALTQEDPKRLAVAESALAHRDYDRAVDLARSYTHDHWNDWRGWMVQGAATLARGGAANDYRVAAIIAYRHATQLAPERLEAWDGYGSAGLELAGADGEIILHEAYEKILAADPFWPDAWERWLMPWRDHAIRERMRRILARHDTIPEIRARIAQLFIEYERYADANLILDPLVALDSTNPRWLALRAQSAFEDGDTMTGVAYYARAITHADRDGSQTLWQQAVGIATPNEIRQWEAGIPPAQRPGWLRSFWARRDPNLFAGINQRVAEHFARLRVARKQFRSTFPLSGYKIRPSQRAMASRPSQGEQAFYQRCEARDTPGGPARFADQARFSPELRTLPTTPYGRLPEGIYGSSNYWQWNMGPTIPGNTSQDWWAAPGASLPDMPYTRDLRDVDTTAAAMGYNLRTGLDDRGITLLRFGAPKKRIIGSTNNVDPFCQLPDLERWVYDDIGTVRFFRPEAVNLGARSGWGSTGELVFRPMADRQFEATETALTKNATSVPAPLSFGVWIARFAGRDSLVDLVVVTTRGTAAAQVASAAEAGPAVRDPNGILTLSARPGRYALNAEAMVSDTLGRQSILLTLPHLGREPGLSDLLLAPAWGDTTVTRQGTLRRIRRDLVFPETTLRVYAEAYGLRPGRDGHVRYRASYQIYPTRRLAEDAQQEELEGGTRLTFDRVRSSAGGPIAEWLDITPEQLPAGRYLLRLEVMEPRRLEVIGRAQIGFDIRPR